MPASRTMRCEGCGGPVGTSNNTGFCTTRPECAKRGRKIRNARPASVKCRQRYRQENPDRQMWLSAKHRAANRGIEFTITLEDVRAVMRDTCPVFGYELRPNQEGTRAHARESYSLDRIENSKGYVPGNLQILSQRANAMKNDATPEELLQFAAWIQATYGAAKGGG